MSVSIAYKSKLSTTETLETNVPAATDKNLRHTGYDVEATVNASSTPPVSKCAFFEKALTEGVATVDLTALAGSGGVTVDGSGLRVQFIKFRNKAGSANVMTLSKGASNGYDGLGADFSITLPPGGEALVRAMDGGTDIGGANKTLDLAGTAAQTAELAIILG